MTMIAYAFHQHRRLATAGREKSGFDFNEAAIRNAGSRTGHPEAFFVMTYRIFREFE
jgi:hypothetical protein